MTPYLKSLAIKVPFIFTLRLDKLRLYGQTHLNVISSYEYLEQRISFSHDLINIMTSLTFYPKRKKSSWRIFSTK